MEKVRKGLDLTADIETIQPEPVNVRKVREVSRKAVSGTSFERSVNRAAPAVAPGRPSRRRAISRTEPFSVRLTPQTLMDIYDLADEMKAKALADVIEAAIEALKEKTRIL